MLNSLDNKNDDFSDNEPGPYRNTFKREYWDIVNVSFADKLNTALQFHKQVPNVKQLNELLHDDYIDKLQDVQYNEMLAFRWKLPTYEKRFDILKAVHDNRVVVISGETGCGKTTQVRLHLSQGSWYILLYLTLIIGRSIDIGRSLRQ